MSADEEDVTITEKDLAALKNDVLKENIYEISSQLGDPGRYFASFKAKEILDRTDCETIKAQVTSMEKANVFIDTISGRCGRKGEHPYDVFVGALKRMKVHIHIVRILNQALAKKIAELKTTKRVQ
uniref:CARD domain-containing protein n=1 Tax=Amphimedon queenslandica TaxID=400682 RepID=A0A1X7V377_AMPQE